MNKVLWILICLTLFSAPAQAVLTIEITEGVEGALPIAISPFAWQGVNSAPENLAAIVDADLNRSGRFLTLPEKEMLQKPTDVREINWRSWRALEVPYLVIGKWGPSKQAAGAYDLHYALYDAVREKYLLGYTIPKIFPAQLRMAAHQISDVIYQELTGERGAFSTRIAYIKTVGAADPRPYWLYIAESDTQNEQVILKSKQPILSPAWSPDSARLAYVKTSDDGPAIYAVDINLGTQKQLSPPGKFSAPTWSPDGKKMAMVGYEGGSTDIFTLDLVSNRLEQITRHWSIDTEPTWAPDGRSLVFNSERGGSPQLYQHSFETGQVKRLTFDGKQNLRASFSPDGRMITFVRLDEAGGYQIAVMELATGEARLLGKPGWDESEAESPSFAPNSSMIIYASNFLEKGGRNKRGVLAAVSVDGRVHQRFSAEGVGEVREPAWSGYLN